MKNCNITLTKKQRKYRHYHQINFIEYEYLTDEEVLHSDQRRIIEQAKFTYSRLGEAFEKQRRQIKDAAETQRKTMEEVKSKQWF